MKCPYSECQKDYNDESWEKAYDGFIDPKGFVGSKNEEALLNRLYIITRKCRFCHNYFHEVFVGHQNYENEYPYKKNQPELEFLISYPNSKTKFEAIGIPKNIRDFFNEAERCRSVGSLTGAGACLRKTVYALCDSKNVAGTDYKDKIVNLPIKDAYKQLLKQIKWLGDNTTKPQGTEYDKNEIDMAINILPFVIDELYLKDEQVEKANKLLGMVRSKSNAK